MPAGLAEVRLERLLGESQRAEKSALDETQWTTSRNEVISALQSGSKLPDSPHLTITGLLLAQESQPLPAYSSGDARTGWQRFRTDAMRDLEQLRREQKAGKS